MKLLLGSVLVAIVAITISGLGFGHRGRTALANPSKIWVVNDHVLQTNDGGLCGGVCEPTTAAGRAAFAATLDSVQADSADASGNVMIELCAPGCSLPPPAGNTWILVQTDGSGTAVSLNGRGLGCTPLCDAVGTQAPDATDHIVVYQITNTGSHSCGDTLIATAIQDAVSLDSNVIVITDGCATPTPTNTPTASPTNTPTATPTSAPTSTPPATQGCLSFGQKTRLFIGILHRLGAHQGEHRYNATYDVNHDGVINIDDLIAVVSTPTCHHRQD